MGESMDAPTNRVAFDRAYRFPITFWGDVRIPPEVKALVRQRSDHSALELGCGLGRFSRYMAQQGLRVTGVDFSQVAIARAKDKAARDSVRPDFFVGDVTHLKALSGPFDVSLDVGCFHCLESQAQRAYVAEVSRLLKPSATHLIWAIDQAPGDAHLTPVAMREIFAPAFALEKARESRRRLVRSHWYWLVRA
jgi:2-polyprenyl-3-methyl-5-hydroxy-6-metoxy-1,4-benzoquinol methylase